LIISKSISPRINPPPPGEQFASLPATSHQLLHVHCCLNSQSYQPTCREGFWPAFGDEAFLYVHGGGEGFFRCLYFWALESSVKRLWVVFCKDALTCTYTSNSESTDPTDIPLYRHDRHRSLRTSPPCRQFLRTSSPAVPRDRFPSLQFACWIFRTT